MGSTFQQLCPQYSGPLTLTAPTAIRLWETFTYTIFKTVVRGILDDVNLSMKVAKTIKVILLFISVHHKW